MNISQPSDWYYVKEEDVYAKGGQVLLERYYSNSLYEVQSLKGYCECFCSGSHLFIS